MRNLFRRISACVLLLLLVVFLVVDFQIARAAPQSQEGFDVDFDSGDLEGWETTPDVIVSDGSLRLYGGNFAIKLGNWGDQETIIRLLPGAQEGECIIHYFVSDRGGYNLILTPDSVILEKGTGPENSLILVEESYQRTPDSWIELSLRVEDGTHTVSVDGQTVLTASDPDPLQPGGFGFHYFGPGALDIDRIVLTPLSVESG